MRKQLEIYLEERLYEEENISDIVKTAVLAVGIFYASAYGLLHEKDIKYDSAKRFISLVKDDKEREKLLAALDKRIKRAKGDEDKKEKYEKAKKLAKKKPEQLEKDLEASLEKIKKAKEEEES